MITYHHDVEHGSDDWRIVEAFPDYAVSSLGLVKRIQPDMRNHRLHGSVLKQAASASRKYLKVSLCRDGEIHSIRVSRLVCEAFNGPPPSARHHCAHNDGDASNNRADNLRWATQVENEADKKLHGTAILGDRHWSVKSPEKRPRGEGHGRAKLTADDVRAIRADTRFQRAIASDFGVSQRAIWSIRAGKTWGHVE